MNVRRAATKSDFRDPSSELGYFSGSFEEPLSERTQVKAGPPYDNRQLPTSVQFPHHRSSRVEEIGGRELLIGLDYIQ
jgi:hypothetical protein